jgi:hypothetical protein
VPVIKANAFHSKDQYTRQFKKWNFKKNLTTDDWRFIGYNREKRIREGKYPGPVTVNGIVIPEDTIKKQLSRHILPSTQYLATVNDDSGMWCCCFILHQLINYFD